MRLQVIDYNDVYVSGEDLEYSYKIQIYGKTPEGESACVNVPYYPYFYVLLKKSDGDGECLFDDIDERVQEAIHDTEILERKDYDGFKDDRLYRFLKISMSSPAYVRKLADHLSTAMKCKLYESNVNPIVQFMHDHHLSGCSRISVSDSAISHIGFKQTKCVIEVDVDDGCAIVAEPSQNGDLVDLKIASFDLEVTSGDGYSFPMASRPDDMIIQVGVSVSHLMSPSNIEKHLISLGSCDLPPESGIHVIECESERELIIEFVNLISSIDPDVLCGYNIYSFDNKYLYERALMLNCDAELSKIGRSKLRQRYEVKRLSSSALGDNEFGFYRTPGRIVIDLMKCVSSSWNLDKYTLDFVSGHFYQHAVRSASSTGRSIVLDSTDGLSAGDFCCIKSVDLTCNVEETLVEKVRITDICSDNNEVFLERNLSSECLQHPSLLRCCLTKDDVPPKEIFRMFKQDGSKGRGIIGKYCVKDCVLVSRLMDKLDIVSNSIGMADTCMVPLKFIFQNGQGVKSYSLVKYNANQEGYLFPTITKDQVINMKRELTRDNLSGQQRQVYTCTNPECESRSSVFVKAFVVEVGDPEFNSVEVCTVCSKVQFSPEYDGAFVKDPIPGYYLEPIVVFDFGSLYPSSIIEKNMSGETQILDKEFAHLTGAEYQYIPMGYGDRKCLFVKKNGALGIIPKTLETLLSKRKEIRKRAKTTDDAFKKRILDGQQLAMKITANSIYGQTGATTSPIYRKDIAACTTRHGQNLLRRAEAFVRDEVPRILGTKK